MTIVVYDGKTIAADRQVTTDATISGFQKKIETYIDGIFVYTGSVTDGPKFRRWLEKGVIPKVSKHFTALFTRNKKVWIVNDHLEPWQAYKPSAIGSNWEAAEMLVRSGMTAEAAAKFICKHDIMCGGKVDVVDV